LESFHDFSARLSGSGFTCPKLIDQEGSDHREPREGIHLLVGCVFPNEIDILPVPTDASVRQVV
jgi:hypothetical protein